MKRKRLYISAGLLIGLALIITLIACLDSKTEKDQPKKDEPPKNHQSLTETQSAVAVAAKGREPVAEKSIFPAQWKLTREVETAITKGARARTTLRVVDSTGQCVPNARVRLNFMFFERKDNFEIGLTDTNGLFSAEKDTMSECNWFIEKEGYYATEGRHSFAANLTNDSVKDGCWQPWDPTLCVVLKEKRNPIPLFTKYAKVFLPEKDKAYGFDCLVGDLVQPFGKGNETDLLFTYSSDLTGEAERRYTNRLVIATSSTVLGIQKMVTDGWSALRSVHLAPDVGYEQEIAFSCKSESPMTRHEVTFTTDTYIVFRSRVKMYENGMVIGANYGKIYPMNFDYGEAPPDRGQGRVELGYYFNPTPNDRNLEFDGKKNLFNPDWRENWPNQP